MKKLFLCTLGLLMWISNVFAVPAFPDLILFRQPNSEISVSIYLKGDEYVHWAETEDGYSLVHSEDGSFVYAMRDKNGDMVASEFLATEIKDRSGEVVEFLKNTPKHLHFSQKQVDELLKIWKYVENAKTGPKSMTDVLGDKKFLVILFAFSDEGFTYGPMAFKMLFNQVNYSINGAKGSVRDYYNDVSCGLFTLKVDVVGPFVGVENTAYYGNTDWGYQAFAREAVDSAAAYVDFSDYDNDGDGFIDGLHIIFAGHGEEAGASADHIWSHKWNIFDPPVYNNTVIDVYSCSPECKGNIGSNMTSIGVICHELGHVFGAPDYYDTDYEGSGGEYPGLGQWDIMSGGSWNRGGIVPAQHNPYTKVFIYKWATCDTLNNKPGLYSLEPVETANKDIHRINTSTSGDFFLIENRQKIKWDESIPGHGMLVYHIHPNANGANVSNFRHPQQIYILANVNLTDTFPRSAPSSYGSLNNGTATYPGTINRDSLTDNSVPWFRPWSKAKNNVPIRFISENTTTGKIYFMLYDTTYNPQHLVAEGLSNHDLALEWEPYGGYKTMIVMRQDNNFTPPTGVHNVGDTLSDGGIVVYKGNNSSMILGGLESDHTYYFTAYACKSNNIYSSGISTQGKTLECDGAEWLLQDFESVEPGALPPCWLGEWTVDEIMGGKAIFSNGDGPSSVVTAPVSLDTLHNAVLHFNYMFGEGSNESSLLQLEYRKDINSPWQPIDSLFWHFGMATWNDAYYYLPEFGDYSKLRFIAQSGSVIGVDNVDIMNGNLVYAFSDENGDILPRGYSIVNEDEDITFTISPLSGFHLSYITVDNRQIDPALYYADENGIITFTLTNTSGQHTVYAAFEHNVSINEGEDRTIAVYPNPTNGIVTVVLPESATITLYSAMGQIIKSIKAEGTVQIDMSRYVRGVYMLKVENKVLKIVKE